MISSKWKKPNKIILRILGFKGRQRNVNPVKFGFAVEKDRENMHFPSLQIPFTLCATLYAGPGLQSSPKYTSVLKCLEQVTVFFLVRRNCWTQDRGLCSARLPYLTPTCTYMWMTGLAHITHHLLLPAWGTSISPAFPLCFGFLSLELPPHLLTLWIHLTQLTEDPYLQSSAISIPGLLQHTFQAQDWFSSYYPNCPFSMLDTSEDPPPHTL